MATIEKGRDLLTLINVFTVDPTKQQELVDVLVEATERTMKRMPASFPPAFTRASTGRA